MSSTGQNNSIAVPASGTLLGAASEQLGAPASTASELLGSPNDGPPGAVPTSRLEEARKKGQENAKKRAEAAAETIRSGGETPLMKALKDSTEPEKPTSVNVSTEPEKPTPVNVSTEPKFEQKTLRSANKKRISFKNPNNPNIRDLNKSENAVEYRKSQGIDKGPNAIAHAKSLETASPENAKKAANDLHTELVEEEKAKAPETEKGVDLSPAALADKKVADLETEKGSLESKIKVLTTEIDELLKQLGGEDAEKEKTLRAELIVVKSQSGGGKIEDLEKQIREKHTELQAIKKRLADVEAELETHKKEAAGLKAKEETDAAADEVQQVEEAAEERTTTLRAQENAKVRRILAANTGPPNSVTKYLPHALNIFSAIYNLEGTIDMRATSKNLLQFLADFGVSHEYGTDIATIIKAFYCIFPNRDGKGLPRSKPYSSEAEVSGGNTLDKLCAQTAQKAVAAAESDKPYVISEDPAFHLICPYLNYRILSLMMEIQLARISALNANELLRQRNALKALLIEGKCGSMTGPEAYAKFMAFLNKTVGGDEAAAATGTTDLTDVHRKLDHILNLLRALIGFNVDCAELDGIAKRLDEMGEDGDLGELLDMLRATKGLVCFDRTTGAPVSPDMQHIIKFVRSQAGHEENTLNVSTTEKINEVLCAALKVASEKQDNEAMITKIKGLLGDYSCGGGEETPAV